MRTKLFGYFLGSSLLVAFAMVALMRHFVPRVDVFYEGPMLARYHVVFPYQYAAALCLAFAFVATFGVRWAVLAKRTNRVVRVMMLVIGTGVAASLPWALLWMVHATMRNGGLTAAFVPTLAWAGLGGLMLTWLVLLLSVPFNLVFIGFGYWLIWRVLPIVAQSNGVEKREPSMGPISLLKHKSAGQEERAEASKQDRQTAPNGTHVAWKRDAVKPPAQDVRLN